MRPPAVSGRSPAGAEGLWPDEAVYRIGVAEAVVGELSDLLWERVLARDPLTALRVGRPVESLPAGGPEAMERDVSFAVSMLGRLAGAGGVDAAFLRDHLQHEAAEAQRFWYRFPVTPYNALPLSAYREEIFEAAEFTAAADAGRYLHLLNDYAALAEQIGGTMQAQRERGIRLPAWAVPQVTATIRGHAGAAAGLLVTADRCAGLAPGPAGRLTDGASAIVGGRLAGAFQRILGDLAADEQAGGDGAGIGQYPGGADCYAGLISLHTGLDLTAGQLHAAGLAETGRITERIRSELGIADEPAYRAALAADPGTYAASPREVERIFQAHTDRVLPELPRYFSRLPAAPFRLRPLNAELSGMTYGYYQPPAGTGAGYYHYNASDLPARPLLQAASVIYHEGLPGHHLQMSLLAESTALHPIRREPTELRTFALAGYLEGWAEYAAGLCEEIGMYADPRDRYGRMTSERFFAARMAVDTGLNVLGWSLEKAAACLRENGFMSDTEIASELLRYALDDPGQALAYHAGHQYLRELRGTQDIRRFHDAVLASGPLPLKLLPASLTASRLAAHDLPRAPGPPRATPPPSLRTTPPAPVGFQNSAIGPELGFYAARSYSLMRPPRTGWRWIRFRERSAAG
jgi:uncharacterized protein (DUF885 family)